MANSCNRRPRLGSGSGRWSSEEHFPICYQTNHPSNGYFVNGSSSHSDVWRTGQRRETRVGSNRQLYTGECFRAIGNWLAEIALMRWGYIGIILGCYRAKIEPDVTTESRFTSLSWALSVIFVWTGVLLFVAGSLKTTSSFQPIMIDWMMLRDVFLL